MREVVASLCGHKRFDSKMNNITLGIGDQIPEILEIESIEHFFPQYSPDIYVKILSWIFTVLILISNGFLIFTIFKKDLNLDLLLSLEHFQWHL